MFIINYLFLQEDFFIIINSNMKKLWDTENLQPPINIGQEKNVPGWFWSSRGSILTQIKKMRAAK